MSIKSDHLRDYVIIPALDSIGLLSDAAINLLLGTCAQESLMGKHLHQLGGGPALGIYQMEPETHTCLWENYLNYRQELSELITKNGEPKPHERLITDLRYATIMARIRYLRVPEALPSAKDIEGLAHYWKNHYNTHKGKGTVKKFMLNYRRYVK